MGEFDSYIETFRQEAEELLADVENCILAIEDSPDDAENVNRLFRAMHTIKGSGSMFGFTEVAAFTHHVETVLDKVRDGAVPISKELIDLVLASRDQISTLIEAANGGPAADPQRGDEIIAGLNALMSTGDAGTAPSPQTPAAQNATAAMDRKTYRIGFHPEPTIFASGTDPAMLLDELRELGEATVMAASNDLPLLDKLNPEQCYLSWEVTLTTESGTDAIRDVFIFVEDISHIEISEVTQDSETMPDLAVSCSDSDIADSAVPRLGEILVERGDATPQVILEALKDQPKIGEVLVKSGKVAPENVEAALSEQRTIAEKQQQNTTKGDTVRVPSERLDQLINLVGELVITQAQLAQVAAKLDNTSLAAPVEEVERLTADLRDIVLNIRMMPIGTTFSRFKRLVRDMSVELGKEIDLVTEGAETEMDKTVIDRLGDPLVHLIRNSIDHGIEDPEFRKAAGKSPKGTIRLAAEHKGANVVISIEDDGKGLDVDLIRRKAIEKGLIAADEELTKQQVFGQIFAPGFSTAAKVTNVSGRGVGMDVVKREIDSLRGSISVSSEAGKGTSIDLSLPLTLAIIEGLLVDVNGDSFVVPLSLIEECLELTADRYALSPDRNVIQVRGEPVPFIRLREVFDIPGDLPLLEETVVVSVGDQRVGIVVDRVIGDHQTVIKSLGDAYKNVEAVSGATILGDGTVALILDVSGLVRWADARERTMRAA